MTQFPGAPLNQDPQIPIALPWSTFLLRLAGYGLLTLSLFDIAETLFPLQLMNPVWEFQTMGAIVERVPLPLLAVVLIFVGEAQFRKKWEAFFLRMLSWATLLFGVLLLLLIPLGATNTLRINQQGTAQISTQFQQQMQQADQIEEQISQATSEEIQAFLLSQGVELEEQNPTEVKDQLLSQLTQSRQTAQGQYEVVQSNRRTALLKSSLKWNLGALVSGFIFVYIWRLTRWARPAKARNRSAKAVTRRA